jgi:hypothetical protein
VIDGRRIGNDSLRRKKDLFWKGLTFLVSGNRAPLHHRRDLDTVRCIRIVIRQLLIDKVCRSYPSRKQSLNDRTLWIKPIATNRNGEYISLIVSLRFYYS